MARLASLFLAKEKESEQPDIQKVEVPRKAAYKILFVDDEENVLKAMRLDPHHPPSYLITFGAAQFGMEQYGF